MTTPLDLDALEALCQAATPGTWEAKNIPYRHDVGPPSDMWDVYCEYQGPGNGWYGVCDNYDEPTAQFVAASRTALPALLAECRRLRAENERDRQIVSDVLQETYLELRDGATFANITLAIAARIELRRMALNGATE
jgi:hypothetical protein